MQSIMEGSIVTMESEFEKKKECGSVTETCNRLSGFRVKSSSILANHREDLFDAICL